MENSHESFWQFSDQLRLQTSTLANLSINDTIWGNSLTAKKPEERKNFDVRVGAERINSSTTSFAAAKTNIINQNGSGGHINGFNNGWKTNIGGTVGEGAQKNVNIDINGGFNKGVYSKFGNNKSNQIINNNNNYNSNNNYKNYKNIKNENVHEGKVGKKNNTNNNNNNTKSSVDKRFKTLPASESLPRNEAIGGYIFVCNNDTMEENLRRQLFGLPPRYRDSVRAITPGLPLFLYNYSTHQLHGIFEASSFGGTNIDPMAWEDKKSAGESRFPAQVRVMLRKLCEPLEEDSFRPILHHYDGPKFRLELNIPEALALLDIFSENNP